MFLGQGTTNHAKVKDWVVGLGLPVGKIHHRPPAVGTWLGPAVLTQTPNLRIALSSEKAPTLKADSRGWDNNG